MFIFRQKQQVFDFGGIRIGGQPGENPTVLIGGLFFKGQEVVENTREGRFDAALAAQWLSQAQEMSERTGHPLMIQIYGRTPIAMERHLSWLADNFDGPFLFESINARARIYGIEYCDERGLVDRAVYNSVNLSMTSEERERLSESSIDKAVVLGWSPRATSLAERMETVESMVSEARRLGMKKILVDPGTLPVGAGYGLEYRTVLAIKSELGLPTSLGPHNAPASWRFIRQQALDTEVIRLTTSVAATVVAQVLATDALMYGSLANSRAVFASVALVGNAIAAAAAEAHYAAGLDTSLFEPPTYD